MSAMSLCKQVRGSHQVSSTRPSEQHKASYSAADSWEHSAPASTHSSFARPRDSFGNQYKEQMVAMIARMKELRENGDISAGS